MNFSLNQEINIHEVNTGAYVHTGIKPYCNQFIDKKVYDYTFTDTSKHYYDFTVFLYKRSLLEIHKDDVNLNADILLDMCIGQSNNRGRQYNKNVLYNTRGFRVFGDIGKNVSFETRFYESQFYYPRYIDSIALNRGIAFGYGRTKPFKTVGFDVGNSSGYVSVKAHKNLNIQFGHDKLFVGSGYRSLLLSDNASNYPMLRMLFVSGNKKWAYQNVNALLQSLYRIPATSSAEALFKRKGASFRYLSFKPNKNWEIGLFEGVIYNKYQDSVGMIPLNYNFYVPIIGFSTAVNGLNGTNNSLLGLNLNYSYKKFNIFGQLALDNINKIGYQLGGKWLEPFGWKKHWLHAEFNTVPSYMYSQDAANILQNYTHTNQEMAHPLGASFKEILAIYHFQKDKWFIEGEFSFTRRIRQGGTLYGEYILKPNDPIIAFAYFEDHITTTYWKIEAGHQFNLKSRMQAYIGIYNRNLYNNNNKAANQSELYYTIGIRMNLNNYYLDL